LRYNIIIRNGNPAFILIEKNIEKSPMVEFVKPLFFGILVSGFIFTYTTAVAVYFRRKAPGARFFSFFLLFVSFWASTYFFETLAQAESWKYFVFYFKYIFIVFVPIVFMQFSMEFTGTTRKERIIVHSLLLLASLIILGLIFTNPMHHLILKDIDIITRNEISLVVIERGFLHYFIDFFLMLIAALGLLLLVTRMDLRNVDQRNHFIVISTAILFPVIGIFLEIFGIGFFGEVDTPTFFFIFSSIVVVYGMINLDLFHINTMSRDMMVDNINEGIIFIGPRKNIIDMNRRAIEILDVEGSDYKERTIKDIDAGIAIAIKNLGRGRKEKYDLSIEKEGRVFDVKFNSIFTSRGSLLGFLVLLQDITERKRYQRDLEKKKDELRRSNEVLEVINKILRHDLINDLMVMKMAKGAYHRTKDIKILDKMDSSLERSLSLIRRMRELEMSMKRGKSFFPVDLGKALREASYKFDLPVNIKGTCKVLADEAVHSILMNLLNNSKKHGGADRVDVIIEPVDGFCRVIFTDNGRGMPMDVAERIFEEGFSHGENRGSGLGMYIVKRTMERYGGTAKIERSGPGGTTIALNFRCA
jgi:PAS domain S-box-containing protein